VAALTKAARVYNTPAFKQASAHIGVWAAKNCPNAGLGATTAG
jgi:hypothetical protein